jgi:lysophospholipase L1-like esterase
MKNKQLETVLILIFTGAILAIYSFLNPSITFPLLKGETVNLNFLPFDKLMGLSLNTTDNSKADSITDNLLAKNKVDTTSKKTTVVDEKISDNVFLSLPSVNGKGALDDFFSALQFEAPKTVVRIGHYGDSQIEGDRITSNIRNKFVNEFGGEGVGFVPFDDIAECVTYTRESSKNWKKFTVFHDKIKTGMYGLSGMSFMYSGGKGDIPDEEVVTDESEISSGRKDHATISLSLRNKYSRLSVQYGNALEPCTIVVHKTGKKEKLGEIILQSDADFVEQEIPLSTNDKNLTISFKGPSPMFYGISFDGKKGVQVDNYGIRGHSGNGLMKIKDQLLAQEIKKSNTRLMILQFGANTIPYVKNEKTLNYIAQEFSKLFKKFKRANENISILVIGVGDMATRIDGEYTSYPMIPQIRDVLKKSALDAGCAYFDMYEYMGGKDAILSWSKKGLASKDGHFSPKGQEIVADEIFNTLNNKFKHFQKKYHLNT